MENNNDIRYLIFMQDEYLNNYYLGIYKSLEEATGDINDFLEIYNKSIDSDYLKEYPSTYGNCFDTPIDLEEGEIWIRGFILNKEEINGAI